MQKFEAVLLYSPDLSSSNLKEQEDFFEGQIKDHKGTIKAQENWGLRDLSYNIKKNKKAFYQFYQLEIEGNKIQDIKKILTQKEQIIRHLFIKVSEHDELPTYLGKN